MAVSLEKLVYLGLLIFYLKLVCDSRSSNSVEASFGYPSQLKQRIRANLEKSVTHVIERLQNVPDTVTSDEAEQLFAILINEISKRNQLAMPRLTDYWLLRQG